MRSEIALVGTVAGRVQGVAFRYSMQRVAQKLGVKGWVMNLSDGRVAFHAQGDEVAVESLLTWAKRGPVAAKVNQLDFDETSEVECEDFSIRY